MRSLPRNFSKLPFVQKLFLLEISAECHQPKGHWGVGLQTHSCTGFLDLSLKTSPRGWHGTWFYCENHEPSLPLFIGRLPEFQGTWSEEPTPLKLPQVAALTNKINLLKEKGLTRVYVATHWLTRRVKPLKKQVHHGWEYNGFQDPTWESQEKITRELLLKHLGEMF
jgi:hypothetical protein